MYYFGKSSTAKIMTLHPDLRAIIYNVMDLQVYDFSIVWGYRNEEQQNKAFQLGNSDKEYPDSKHNHTDDDGEPMSLAFDFGPYIIGLGIPWKDTHAFAILGGMFIAIGRKLGIRVRYGGDWDMDGQTTDHKLKDWGHIELV